MLRCLGACSVCNRMYITGTRCTISCRGFSALGRLGAYSVCNRMPPQKQPCWFLLHGSACRYTNAELAHNMHVQKVSTHASPKYGPHVCVVRGEASSSVYRKTAKELGELGRGRGFLFTSGCPTACWAPHKRQNQNHKQQAQHQQQNQRQQEKQQRVIGFDSIVFLVAFLHCFTARIC